MGGILCPGSSEADTTCPPLYPVCDWTGICTINGAARPWTKAPSAATSPAGTDYNYINGYDNQGTSCSRNYEASNKANISSNKANISEQTYDYGLKYWIGFSCDGQPPHTVAGSYTGTDFSKCYSYQQEQGPVEYGKYECLPSGDVRSLSCTNPSCDAQYCTSSVMEGSTHNKYAQGLCFQFKDGDGNTWSAKFEQKGPSQLPICKAGGLDGAETTLPPSHNLNHTGQPEACATWQTDSTLYACDNLPKCCEGYEGKGLTGNAIQCLPSSWSRPVTCNQQVAPSGGTDEVNQERPTIGDTVCVQNVPDTNQPCQQYNGRSGKIIVDDRTSQPYQIENFSWMHSTSGERSGGDGLCWFRQSSVTKGVCSEAPTTTTTTSTTANNATNTTTSRGHMLRGPALSEGGAVMSAAVVANPHVVAFVMLLVSLLSA